MNLRGNFDLFYSILRICWTFPNNLIFSRLVLRASHGFFLTMRWLMTGEYIRCQMIPSHFWSEACKKDFCARTCKYSLPIVLIIAERLATIQVGCLWGGIKSFSRQYNVCELKCVRQRWHVQPTKFKTLLEIYSHGIKLDVFDNFLHAKNKKRA